MIDKFFTFLGTVFAVVALAIALRQSSQTSAVIKATTDGVSNLVKAVGNV
jgi:hypothetical protein